MAGPHMRYAITGVAGVAGAAGLFDVADWDKPGGSATYAVRVNLEGTRNVVDATPRNQVPMSTTPARSR